MTESALAPARIAVSPMCEQCEKIREKISHYRGFLGQRFDPLTEQRIEALIADLESRIERLQYWAAPR
jgi:hypothetical protein